MTLRRMLFISIFIFVCSFGNADGTVALGNSAQARKKSAEKTAQKTTKKASKKVAKKLTKKRNKKKVPKPKSNLHADFKWVQTKLKDKDYPGPFLQTLKDSYEQKSFDRVLQLNLLGFIKPPQHMSLVSDEATRQSQKFIEKNAKAFERASTEFGVPAEIISSLLWIETRHGSLTGTFHVPSVYLHLMQADRKENQTELLRLAVLKMKKEAPGRFTKAQLETNIRERAERRSLWAVEQIDALAEIHKLKMKDVTGLRGSFAGAFGMPQFIPSSYRVWASSARAQAAPDLFAVDDAILSVGNYLKVHGWDNAKEETHVEALMKYNQSRDYADSIIEIARRLRTQAHNTTP